MMKYLYSQYNKLSGDYSAVITDIVGQDQIVEKLRGELFYVTKDALNNIAENDLFLIGVLDTKTGIIEPKNDFIVHLSEITSEILTKKFGDDNG